MDKAIISCKGIDMEKGVTDSHEMEADVKIGMCNCAKTVILAADSSKMGEIYFVKVWKMRTGDILVTDKLPDQKWKEHFEKKGVQVLTEDNK